MKSALDPRHTQRRKIVKELFATAYAPQAVSPTTKKILAKVQELDQLIAAAAPAWPVEKLNKIDLAVLRLSVFELLQKDIPTKVVIDEAVELAKEFGSETSGPFVNGVLGAVVKKLT